MEIRVTPFTEFINENNMMLSLWVTRMNEIKGKYTTTLLQAKQKKQVLDDHRNQCPDAETKKLEKSLAYYKSFLEAEKESKQTKKQSVKEHYGAKMTKLEQEIESLEAEKKAKLEAIEASYSNKIDALKVKKDLLEKKEEGELAELDKSNVYYTQKVHDTELALLDVRPKKTKEEIQLDSTIERVSSYLEKIQNREVPLQTLSLELKKVENAYERYKHVVKERDEFVRSLKNRKGLLSMQWDILLDWHEKYDGDDDELYDEAELREKYDSKPKTTKEYLLAEKETIEAKEKEYQDAVDRSIGEIKLAIQSCKQYEQQFIGDSGETGGFTWPYNFHFLQ